MDQDIADLLMYCVGQTDKVTKLVHDQNTLLIWICALLTITAGAFLAIVCSLFRLLRKLDEIENEHIEFAYRNQRPSFLDRI